MIRIQHTANELTLLYNEHIVFVHRPDQPVFFLGWGEQTIVAHQGNYAITDDQKEFIGLDQVSVTDSIMTFSHNDLQLKVEPQEINQRLHLTIIPNDTYNRFAIRIHAIENEYIYGLGEQPSYLNLRGRHYPIWTREAGVGRDKLSPTAIAANELDNSGGDYHTTYYPEPTFVSSRKYWLHVDTYAYADFDFSPQDHHSLYIWDVPTELVLSYQPTYIALVEDITNYTGHVPPLPAYLAKGIVYGLQGGHRVVQTILEQSLAANIQVAGLWCQDWAGYKYTTFGRRLFWNWVVNETSYPNLVHYVKQLQQQGIQFLTYICPFLLEEQSLFLEAEAKGYLVLNPNHEVYRIDFGEFLCGAVDLTNPEAFAWYKGVITTNIIDLGITGWMADFGEYLPVDAVLHNQQTGLQQHNKWPVLWARCNYEAVEEAGKLGEIFYFMRSGAFGSQRYATALWSGDQSVNWERHDGIPSVIPAALSTGLIGNPFNHSDIGGYTSLYGNVRTKELFERWLEMNVFTAIMRTHEGNRPSENFQFYQDNDTLQLLARMTRLRSMLEPYILHLYQEGSERGLPVQRPLFLHYEADASLYERQDSFLFGQDIFVQPVLQPGVTTQEVGLPADDWIHLFTGELYHGSQSIWVDAPIGTPPVFYRKQSQFAALFDTITVARTKEGII